MYSCWTVGGSCITYIVQISTNVKSECVVNQHKVHVHVRIVFIETAGWEIVWFYSILVLEQEVVQQTVGLLGLL